MRLQFEILMPVLSSQAYRSGSWALSPDGPNYLLALVGSDSATPGGMTDPVSKLEGQDPVIRVSSDLSSVDGCIG